MLIFDSKKGRFGTQKPKQWGPLSTVRSAVFRNAEAMGIDPSTIISIIPLFWANSAAGINYVVGGTPIQSQGKGYIFNGSGDYFNFDLSNKISGLEKITIITAIKSDVIHSDRPIIGGYGTQINADTLFSIRYDEVGFVGGGTDVIKVALGGVDTADSSMLESSSHVQTSNHQRLTVSWSRGGNISLYIDGVLDSPTAIFNSDNAIGEITGLYIGRGRSAKDFDGLIEDVSVFSTELSDDRISQLNETPYALLQPNPTPVFFDMASTPVTGWSHKIYGITPTKVNGATPVKVMGV